MTYNWPSRIVNAYIPTQEYQYSSSSSLPEVKVTSTEKTTIFGSQERVGKQVFSALQEALQIAGPVIKKFDYR